VPLPGGDDTWQRSLPYDPGSRYGTSRVLVQAMFAAPHSPASGALLSCGAHAAPRRGGGSRRS